MPLDSAVKKQKCAEADKKRDESFYLSFFFDDIDGSEKDAEQTEELDYFSLSSEGVHTERVPLFLAFGNKKILIYGNGLR